MEYEIRRVGDVAIIDLSGRITFHELSALEPDGTILRKIIRELLAEGHRKVVLNLAKVTHIDSSGVNELVRASATVRNKGGQLRIANSSVAVREIFQVTKLDTILDMSLDEATALQSF
ncbi:MAG TPA: STAS domain-containing protein [Terriglobales bacterium]|nr:STAS domain-containing protein [Terriglobales bacterium]